ncbi:hypothetical protein B0H14DRAFT_3151133 [Mycena olivaceomarginata]|nr:hypothetical protein B0H14DRAFT_3151133 [Mycena olivaceomarginata]
MNDAGDHSAPSTHLVHNITFPVRPLPFLRPLYIPDNPRSFPSPQAQHQRRHFTRCDRSNSNSRTPAGRPVRWCDLLCTYNNFLEVAQVFEGPASEARRRASSRAINISFPYTVPKAPHRLQTRLRSYPFFVFQVAIKYDKDIDTFSIRRCTRPRHHQLSPTRQRTANTSTEVLDLQGTGCGLGTLPPIV